MNPCDKTRDGVPLEIVAAKRCTSPLVVLPQVVKVFFNNDNYFGRGSVIDVIL